MGQRVHRFPFSLAASNHRQYPLSKPSINANKHHNHHSLIAHEDLGAAVLHCASKLRKLLAGGGECRGAKVDELDMESVVHDHVLVFHIAMDDVEGVQVGEGGHDLWG